MMYRQHEKRTSRAVSLWSVLKYDLGTAIDVLGLPCLVKLSESDVNRIISDVTGNGVSGDYQVKFEGKFSFYQVCARVCELNDLDWFTWCKGEDFVDQHRRLVGREFYIPLEYKGNIKLADRTENKEYFSIFEVIRDFPKLVRVEKDTACFSPGDANYHVVHKGTVLVLDRVTQNNRSAGGSCENFLICFERDTGREIAFRIMSPVHFRRVHDNTKYAIKQFIENVPLPQRVEFLNVNPYDVVVADDEIANEILVMLSGPVELLELKRCEYLIGQIQNTESGEVKVLAMPTDSETSEDFLVYIPNTVIIDNENDYANTVIPGQTDCDIFRHKLYSNSVANTSPLLLNCDSPSCVYDITETPDTPPLPPKYDFATLRSTLSEQHMTGSGPDENQMDTCRRRFLSTGDLKGRRSRSSLRSVDRETRGIKGYLSHLSHRFKSSATQLFFGVERQTDSVFMDKSQSPTPRKLSIRNFLSQRQTHLTENSFVCYLDCSEGRTLAMSNIGYALPGSQENTANLCSANSENDKQTNNLTENSANHISANNLNENVANEVPEDLTEKLALPKISVCLPSEEVVYATVKKVKKDIIKTNTSGKIFRCQVCRENYEKENNSEK